MADVAHSPGFLKLVESVRPSVREVDVVEARRRAAQGAILVDVREDREWEAGHARGAVHIGKGVIERDIEQKIPDANAEIILYCGGGFRSALAADSLRKMGYGNVASMAGGWRAWEAAGGETESGNS
ncbi:MAG: rhodanese-like domain-containing protein [Gemmatimonadaceae bacterium]|nr:rhodanese-like domain-containing protein [Gemmatimonadaceae bacterium]